MTSLDAKNPAYPDGLREAVLRRVARVTETVRRAPIAEAGP